MYKKITSMKSKINLAVISIASGILICGIAIMFFLGSNESYFIDSKLQNIKFILMLISMFLVVTAAGLLAFNFLLVNKLFVQIKNITDFMIFYFEKADFNKSFNIKTDTELDEMERILNKFLNKFFKIFEHVKLKSLEIKKNCEVLSKEFDKNELLIKTIGGQNTFDIGIEKIHSSLKISNNTLGVTRDSVGKAAISLEELVNKIREMSDFYNHTTNVTGNIAEMVNQNAEGVEGVSSSFNDVTSSINSVATAIQQIDLSLHEVNKKCERSILITTDADLKAKDTNVIIEKLSVSSKQIGKVINVINDLADQTNMLALNAAIEAAGAGESGKGFAIVANEVKELAKQTADATNEISQQIMDMQNNMSEAVKAVEKIAEVIQEIFAITGTIANSVTKQSTTTTEISKAVVKAADKANYITKEITDIVILFNNIKNNIMKDVSHRQEKLAVCSEILDASMDIYSKIKRSSLKLENVSKDVDSVTNGFDEFSDGFKNIYSVYDDLGHENEFFMNNVNKLKNISDELAEILEKEGENGISEDAYPGS